MSTATEDLTYLKREELSCTARLWILIEYHTVIGSNKTPTKCYEVVDAQDVCGAGGRGNTTLEMTTGKLIYVKRDKVYIQATIVTISDDKNFLDNELQDLIELQKNEQNQQQIAKKRKRTGTPKNDVTSNQYQRWNSHDSSKTPTTQSVIISNPNVTNCPPMTFDQRTQTDFDSTTNDFNSIDSRFSKVLTNQENIIRSQHDMMLENQELKQSILDISTHMNEMKSILNHIVNKMDSNGDHLKQSSGNESANDSVLNYSINGTPKILNQTPRILNSSQQSLTPQQTFYNTISIEQVDASNDSNFSFSNSRRSFSVSNQSIYHAEINRSTASLNTSNSDQLLKHENVDDEGNADDDVIIGENQTTVKRSILKNINWNQHTHATRKLLTAKFSREILATHSLTGKPSPAFMDSAKPTKNQLDAKIIADIVKYVSNRCNVSDTAVRSAITTKCADENKMMRQRMEKERKVLAAKIENNKENFKNRN